MFKEGLLVQALPQFVQVEKFALYAFMLPLHRNIAYENVQRNIRWENKKKETVRKSGLFFQSLLENSELHHPFLLPFAFYGNDPLKVYDPLKLIIM